MAMAYLNNDANDHVKMWNVNGAGNYTISVTDSKGQIYELNNGGYIDAFGTNNPVPMVHIRGRK